MTSHKITVNGIIVQYFNDLWNNYTRNVVCNKHIRKERREPAHDIYIIFVIPVISSSCLIRYWFRSRYLTAATFMAVVLGRLTSP